jgi:hypothetical protein
MMPAVAAWCARARGALLPTGIDMQKLSPNGQQAINDIAARHGFSFDAVQSMLESVINGNGSMAQFNHPEFAGSGQWMSGGMTMVSDMFNNYLKGRVDGLCSELSRLVAAQPNLLQSGSFQSQSQGGQGGQQQNNYGGQGAGGGNGGSNGAANFGNVSLFVPPAPGMAANWWGNDLRYPNSTGAQNGVRYAHFAQARRLAIEVQGRVTIYDTLDHQIGSFSQQQSYGGSLSFSSQYGLIDVASLPVVSVDGVAQNRNLNQGNGGNQAPAPAPAPVYMPVNAPANALLNSSTPGMTSPAPGAGGNEGDIFAMIEKLADLHGRGIFSAEEFAAKKMELLARL